MGTTQSRISRTLLSNHLSHLSDSWCILHKHSLKLCFWKRWACLSIYSPICCCCCSCQYQSLKHQFEVKSLFRVGSFMSLFKCAIKSALSKFFNPFLTKVAIMFKLSSTRFFLMEVWKSRNMYPLSDILRVRSFSGVGFDGRLQPTGCMLYVFIRVLLVSLVSASFRPLSSFNDWLRCKYLCWESFWLVVPSVLWAEVWLAGLSFPKLLITKGWYCSLLRKASPKFHDSIFISYGIRSCFAFISSHSHCTELTLPNSTPLFFLCICCTLYLSLFLLRVMNCL
jgi:hypothetical protein